MIDQWIAPYRAYLADEINYDEDCCHGSRILLSVQMSGNGMSFIVVKFWNASGSWLECHLMAPHIPAIKHQTKVIMAAEVY